jgi:hypothetical protein
MKEIRARARAWILAAALAALAAGIASGCGGLTRYVDIDSKPTGASIYVNGEPRGTTRDEKVRLEFAGDPSARAFIQIVKPRYKPTFQYWKMDEVPEKKIFLLEVD